MDQMSFSEAEFQHKKRKTRREKFLERMDTLIPWSKLEARIAPFYPKGKGVRYIQREQSHRPFHIKKGKC